MLPVLGSVALLNVANADEPSRWKVGGSLDLYYLHDFNRSPSGMELFGRQYDVKSNTISIAAAQLNVSGKPLANSDVSITLQLKAGRNAEIDNLAEPGGQDRYKYINQAYISYPIKNTPWTVDLGKFATPVGYEVSTSGDNDNYGRSFLFTLAQPLYHTGLRVGGQIAKTVSVSGGVVNGWNEVDNSNGQMSFFGSVSYTPTSTLTLVGTWYGGLEGSSSGTGGIAFATAGKRNVNLGDLVVTYQATKALKLGLNADVASADGFEGSSSGSWRGIAGYAKYQFTPSFSVTGRYETFSDPDGIRTGSDVRLNELTLTGDYILDKATLLRLEYRTDTGNYDFFQSDDGLKKNRGTLSLSVFFHF